MAFLPRAHKWIVDTGNALGAYIVMFGIWGAAVTWIVQLTKPFKDQGWGWPEAVLIGLLGIVVLLFAMAAFFIGWRAFKPAKPDQHEDPAPLWSASDAADAAADAAAAADTVVEAPWLAYMPTPAEQQTHERLAAIETELDGIAADGAAQRLTVLENWAIRTNTRFRALWHRELMKDREDVLAYWSNILDAYPIDPNQTWEMWQQNYGYFDSHLKSWQDLAKFYNQALVDKVFECPKELYKSVHWTMDLSRFPNPDAIHDFKSYRITKKNYDEARSEVNNRVTSEIFDMT